VALAVGCTTTRESTPDAAPGPAPERTSPGTGRVQALLEALRDREYGLTFVAEHPTADRVLHTARPALAELLGLEDRDAVLAGAAAALEHRDGLVVGGAALALAWHGDQRGERQAQRLVTALDMHTRMAACQALGELADPGSVSALLDRLQHDLSPEVRRAAAQALGRAGDPRALPELRRLALAPDNPFARRLPLVAVTALGRLGGRPAIEALGEVLERAAALDLQRAAARALGSTLEPAAIPVLIGRIDPEAPPALLESLDAALALLTYGGGPPSVGLGGRATAQAADAWNAWWRAHALEDRAAWRRDALAKLFSADLDREVDLIPYLVLLLESPLPWQRRVAHEELLVQSGGTVTIPARALYELQDPRDARAVADWQAWASR
jgi:HEAT repeat protein